MLALLDDGPRLVDPAAPVLRADDLGVSRGESVFETVRLSHGCPVFLDEHLQRWQTSAARLEIELPDRVRELATFAVRHWPESDGALRLTCSKGPPGAGPVCFAHVSAVPPAVLAQREHGVSAVTLPFGVPASLRREAPWLLGGTKSTSYAVNMASLRAAGQLGAQEAVWVSSDGFVLEAPTSTVAWVKDGTVVTPDADEIGILRGTTVAVALALCEGPVEQRLGTVDELRGADEVLLLSSIRGVAPVVCLDGRTLGIGPVGTALRAGFERAVLEAARGR